MLPAYYHKSDPIDMNVSAHINVINFYCIQIIYRLTEMWAEVLSVHKAYITETPKLVHANTLNLNVLNIIAICIKLY